MGNVFREASKPFRSFASETGKAVSNIGRTVEKAAGTINKAIDTMARNPLPVIETYALSSMGLPPDVSAAVVTYANGGSAQDAAIAYGAINAGQFAAEKFGAPATYGTDVGSEQSKQLAAQEAGISTVEKSAIGGAAGAGTQAALRGKSLSDVAKSAATGGAVGGGAEYISESLGMQPGTTGEATTKTLASSTLSNIIGGRSTPPSYISSPPTSVTTTGAGSSPGSSALAQALRTDLGAPVFGGDKDKEGKKSGWNVESLRYMGGTGES